MMKAMLTGALVAALLAPLSAQRFEAPQRLQVAGEDIDTDVGHAGPFVGDFDGDGKRDLLVGQFGGGILWIYRNTGTEAEPVFARRRKFEGTVPTG